MRFSVSIELNSKLLFLLMLSITHGICYKQVYLIFKVMMMLQKFQKVLEKIQVYGCHFQRLFGRTGFTLPPFTLLNQFMDATQRECNFCETGYNRNSLYKKNLPRFIIILYGVVNFFQQHESFLDQSVNTCVARRHISKVY